MAHKESIAPDTTNWKRGPLPPETWGWGGVVQKGMEVGGGFHFADFQGDKVVAIGADDGKDKTLAPDDVAWFNNSLTLAPGGRAKE